jgi:prepilin peptidase CpaA
MTPIPGPLQPKADEVSENLEMIFALIFVVCVIYAIISDFSGLRIPNIVSIVLVAAFAAYAALGGAGDVWPNVLLADGVFVFMFIFFALGWLGAGDVKFLSALTLWAGPTHSASFMLLFAIFGGVFALLLLALRTAQGYLPIIAELPVLSKFSRWARNGLCPYGIPIGVAALCVAPSIFLMR